MKKKVILTKSSSVVNEALNKYSNVILFEDKYLKAVDTIKRVGLPKAVQLEQKLK